MKAHVIVAGLGRCGTTLIMHMLHAAGVPCIGKRPSFEVPEINGAPVERSFLSAHEGRAFKLLDPHRTILPSDMLPAAVIWLDRNPAEQAKSQAKFAHLVGGFPRASREHLRRWAIGLRADRKSALQRFEGWPLLPLRFEGLIDAPHTHAALIAKFLRSDWPGLDHRVMAAKVLSRSSDCQPGAEIEMRLMDEAEAV